MQPAVTRAATRVPAVLVRGAAAVPVVLVVV